MLSWGRKRQSISLWTKLWFRVGELIYRWERTMKVYCWYCQLKSNSFWWYLLTDMMKKAFSIVIATYDTWGYVSLIKQWSCFWCSSCNWSHHLVKLMTLHCSLKSTFFHISQVMCIEWGCGGNHIQVLDDGTNLYSPSRNALWLPFTILLGRWSSSGFHLIFLTIIALTSQVKEPICRFFQLLSMSITSMNSSTQRKNKNRMNPGTHSWTKIPSITWPP